MFSYYTSIILLSWMALGVLCILIRENGRISRADKRLLCATYALIAVSALAEWCGVQLDGRADTPRWLFKLVKCVDYILTPMAGGALVIQIRVNNRWQKALMAILGLNTAFQLISVFTGWMVVIDGENHYAHGPLYGVYMLVCLAIIAIVVVQFILYGRSYRRQNRWSLYAIIALVVIGIAIQEGLPRGHRVSYIAMTIGAALMFIHYTEFSQLATDDFVSEQRIALDTDPLTGLRSRYAYSRALKRYDMKGALPDDLAAFTVDINGLKEANDTLGHDAGDELICGAARCIERAFSAGRFYRTGGDEFVVLATDMNRVRADVALSRLRREADKWRGGKGQGLKLAAGYALAADSPGLTSEKLVHEADLQMYEAKAEYYRKTGLDRRRPLS